MNRCAIFVFVLVMSCVAASGICAENLVTEGAYLRLLVDLDGFAPEDAGNTPTATLIAGAGSKLRVLEIDGATCYVMITKARGDKELGLVSQGRVYSLPAERLGKRNCVPTRQLYIGALTLPFKYRFEVGSAGSSLLTSDINLGGALGWTITHKYLTLTPFVFGGLQGITLDQSGTGGSDSQLGLSYGGGFSFFVKPQTQIALVVGFDHLGGAAGENWQYEDKIWGSLAIGFKVLDIK